MSMATAWLVLGGIWIASSASALDAGAIGKAIGSEAKVTPEGVVRVAWPRTEVRVTVDGAPLDPAAGLGSWAAFQDAGQDTALLMGDTVVFEDEITPALDAALGAGLEVTALHNHFAFDRPRVFFMHVGGHGDPQSLARGVRSVWEAIRAVRKAQPQPGDHFPGEPPIAGKLDAARLAAIVGHDAEQSGGVVKVTIPRSARAHGVSVGGALGLTTWAAFAGSDARASVDGDFLMTSGEVQPVLRALRGAAIHVVALHNHMVDEEPRLFFLHYWGKGTAENLARGVRAALDAQHSATATH